METFGNILDVSYRKIPLQFRIWDTCSMSIALIGGKLYSNHPKKLNSVHKDSKDLVSVITTLGDNITGGECVLWQSKTDRFGKKTSRPKTFMWQIN